MDYDAGIAGFMMGGNAAGSTLMYIYTYPEKALLRNANFGFRATIVKNAMTRCPDSKLGSWVP